MTLFEHLPDHANTWLYASDRALTDPEVKDLLTALEPFRNSWTTHGRRVESGAAIVDNRILILAAHVPEGDLSGCGIDKSLHVLDGFASTHDFAWVSGLMVVYRSSNGHWETVSRPVFADRASKEEVDASTPVVDLSVRSLHVLRIQGIERPAGSTWLTKYLPVTS